MEPTIWFETTIVSIIKTFFYYYVVMSTVSLSARAAKYKMNPIDFLLTKSPS